jgi:hypothetical protein
MLSVTILLSVSASRLHKFTLIDSPSTAHVCRGIVFDCDRQADLQVTDLPPSSRREVELRFQRLALNVSIIKIVGLLWLGCVILPTGQLKRAQKPNHLSRPVFLRMLLPLLLKNPLRIDSDLIIYSILDWKLSLGLRRTSKLTWLGMIFHLSATCVCVCVCVRARALVWRNRWFMAACYRQLNPEHVFSFTENFAISRPYSPCVSGDPMVPPWNYWWILGGGTWSYIKLADSSFYVSTACFSMFKMITIFSIQM